MMWTEVPGLRSEPGVSDLSSSGSMKCHRYDAIITSVTCSIFGCINATHPGHAGLSAASFTASSFRERSQSGPVAMADT
jgi:hypothetical protein